MNELNEKQSKELQGLNLSPKSVERKISTSYSILSVVVLKDQSIACGQTYGAQLTAD